MSDFAKGSYTNHVDQAGGRGGFQMVHVSPQGGVNRMVHVDFFSGEIAKL